MEAVRYGACADTLCRSSDFALLEPVRVRIGGRFAVGWYCTDCAEMIRAYNGSA